MNQRRTHPSTKVMRKAAAAAALAQPQPPTPPKGEDGEDAGALEESRSFQRRHALAILELARVLTEMPAAELARLPLSEELAGHVHDTRRITAQIARKRQLQFLAKQMRRLEDELPPIVTQLESAKTQHRQDVARQRQREDWRQRLIDGGDAALNDFLAEHPGADRQQLRQLVRRALDERRRGLAPAAARELFRRLGDWVADGA